MPDPGSIDQSGQSPERALEALRASESRYRSVVAALAEGVSLYDEQGRLVASNPMASRILGLDSEAYRERPLHDTAWQTVHEDGTPFKSEDYPAVRTLRTGEPLWNQVMGVRSPDGSLRWISINTQPIFEPGSARPSLVVASFADVTDRKLAETRLRESEDRYRSLVENAPIGIGVHQEGRFVYANAELGKLLGAASPQMLVGRAVIDFVHPDWKAVVVERIRRIKEGGEVAPTIEERLIGLDGREVDVEVAGSPCAFNGVPGVQIAIRDVTERKRLERQLLQSQKMEAVGRLASGVAHEFGNLLTAITGYTALAKRTLSPNHPAVQALDRVQEAAEQASGVTASLLTFGRKSVGVKGPIALVEPVERAARLLRRTLPSPVELVVKADGAASVWVMADANQLQQAIVNLAINARDAMRGMPRGRLEIAVGPAPGEESMAQVRVSDTGHGMTPEVQAHLFEPFFTTKPPGEGTGLGLAIVRSIVDDHGGRVEVRSRPGEGASVTLLIPRVARPEIAAPASDVEAKPAVGLGRTVLLAGAARHARELMAGALIDMGFTVVQAADGPTLMERRAAVGGEAGLLVIGADLPGRSGLDCLAALRRAGDRTPAIIVSDRPVAPLDDRSTTLVEPFQMSELASMAARLTGAQPGGGEQSHE